MLKYVLDYIKKYNMLKPGSNVVVGISGGADSVCLLHVLIKLKDILDIELYPVHIHHGIRGSEADRDERFAMDFCSSFGISCRTVHLDVKRYASSNALSEEEAGRLLRYNTFNDICSSLGVDNTVIAVAHHSDDNAETILHNLFRGSGLKGLSGISPVRGNIIRPLLCLTREDIEKYLKKENIKWCEDSTNKGMDYTRNRLRNNIIPEIKKEINEGAVSNIINAGIIIGEADDYISSQAHTLIKTYSITENNRIGIQNKLLKEQAPVMQAYVIRAMIYKMSYALKDVTAKNIITVRELIYNTTGKSIDLPYGLKAVKDYEKLWIEKAEISTEHTDTDIMEEPILTRFKNTNVMDIPKKKYTKWFDYDKIKNTLSIRKRQSGDYITIAGGGKKTIKAYMTDEKIPKEKRDKILLLADGKHILWIVGYRISEYYKVTDRTKEIIQVQFEEGEKDHG